MFGGRLLTSDDEPSMRGLSSDDVHHPEHRGPRLECKLQMIGQFPKYTLKRIWYDNKPCDMVINWCPDTQQNEFYYEAEVVKLGDSILIGIAPCCWAPLFRGWKYKEMEKVGCRLFPINFFNRWSDYNSIEYNGSTSKICHVGIDSSEQSTVVKAGDVIGCGKLTGPHGYVYFTLNGKMMNETIKYDGGARVFPLFNLEGVGAEIQLNVGHKKFVFDPKALNQSRLTISKSFSDEWTKQANSTTNLAESLAIFDHLKDVTVIPKDGGELRCHGLILSIRSPVFKAMLEPEKNLSKKIKIDDFDTPTIKKMLKYMYFDKIDAEDEINMDLLAISNIFQFESLQSFCERNMCDMLTDDNVMEAWIGANMLERNVLRDACETYLESRWLEVEKTESYTSILKNNPEHVASLALKMVHSLILTKQKATAAS